MLELLRVPSSCGSLQLRTGIGSVKTTCAMKVNRQNRKHMENTSHTPHMQKTTTSKPQATMTTTVSARSNSYPAPINATTQSPHNHCESLLTTTHHHSPPTTTTHHHTRSTPHHLSTMHRPMPNWTSPRSSAVHNTWIIPRLSNIH